MRGWTVGIALLLAAGAIAWLLRPDTDPSRGTRAAGGRARAGAREATPPADAPVAEAESAEARPLPPPVDLEAVDRERDLHGVVVRATDGAPIAGADLRVVTYPGRRTSVLDTAMYDEVVEGPSTRSARDGTFAIRLDPGAIVGLRAAAEGYAPTELALRQAGERVRVELGEGARVVVVVTDERGHAVPDASMELFRSDARGSETFRVGPARVEGNRYQFAPLPGPSTAYLEIKHARLGYPGWIQLTLPATGETVEEVVLPDGRTLRGTVVDATTRRPVAGARVGMNWVMDPWVTTGADGAYELPGWVGKGVNDVHVLADGYGRAERRVGTDDVLDFELQPGDSVTGVVRSAEGAAFVGARVTAVGSKHVNDNQEICTRSGSTDANGRFLIEGLRRDLPHTLVVMTPQCARYLLDFDPFPRQPGTIDVGEIRLPPTGTVAGRVLDDTGAPVPRVTVTLRGCNADRNRLTGREIDRYSHYGMSEGRRTDDLGRFEFPNEVPAAYTLIVRPEGATETERETPLETGQERIQVEIRLGLTREFRVRLVDEEGKPIAGAWLQLRTDGDYLSGQSDSGGVAVFSVAGPPRSLNVYVPDSDLVQGDFPIETDKDEWTLVLHRSAPITGLVLAPDGKPLGRAYVSARDGEETLARTVTDDQGRFSLRVRPGTVCDVLLTGVVATRGVVDEHRYRAVRERVAAGEKDVILQATEVPQDATLRVVALLPDGSPAAGANVWAGQKRATADENGRATLTGLPADSLVVGAWWHGGAGAVPVATPARVEVEPRGQEITLRFRTAAPIRGVVVDANGEPVAKVTLFVVRPGAESPLAGYTTRDDGTFEVIVAADEAGPLQLRAQPSGSMSATVIEVAPGQSDLRVVLEGQK